MGYQIDDKTTIIHLSNTVNEVTSNLIKTINDVGAGFADDLESVVYPLNDIIALVWSTPMEDGFQENLYFLFDKILDIAYCIYEILDDVWKGSLYLIESKLSQISMQILQIVDDMNTFGENDIDDFDKLTKIREAIAELAFSLVGLTSITSSIAHLISTEDRKVSAIVGTIASTIMIHEYVVAAVTCLLSRAAKVKNSLGVTHATGIADLEGTLINFVTNLKQTLLLSSIESTMTQLFHGDLHTKLAMDLLIAMKGLTGNRMINTIYNTTTSLLNIIEKHASETFHVLPDLISQLTVILLRCGQTEFGRLEKFITYAFDGLYDVLNHISYKLDRHIQSSASTGSFPEPSEPIDVAVTNVRAVMKRFISQHQSNNRKNFTTELIASISDLMKVLLAPMNTVIDKSDNDFSITLASSLQFIALYVIGLVATPFVSAVHRFQITNSYGDMYSDFGARLSLVLVKVQLIFEYSDTQSTMDKIKGLCASFDDLFQELKQLKSGLESSRGATFSAKSNALIDFLWD